MPIYYRAKKKSYIKNGVREQKYFAVPKTKGTLEIKELAKEISEGSIVKESTVIPVLMEFSNVLKRKLAEGYNIKLEGIGTFGVAITSQGVDNPDDITPKQVEYSKLTYRPDSRLVKALKEAKYLKEPPAPKGYVSKAEIKQAKAEAKQKKL
ncbi:MAG: HU family DNA-binding protein [Bacteroidales bacterium]|nr:HU family DNA-binding protein [Bacteroidales bacterium]